jgi:GcrA cell cycle regulator
MIEKWPQERIDELMSLINEGLSFKELGKRMRLSKNAVIGKIHRLTGDEKPVPTTIDRLNALNIFPPPGHCVFPDGDPNTSDFSFCGSPVIDIFHPYCKEHRIRAYASRPQKKAA